MKHGAGQKQDFAKFTTSMQSLKIAKTQETNDPPPKKQVLRILRTKFSSQLQLYMQL